MMRRSFALFEITFFLLKYFVIFGYCGVVFYVVAGGSSFDETLVPWGEAEFCRGVFAELAGSALVGDFAEKRQELARSVKSRRMTFIGKESLLSTKAVRNFKFGNGWLHQNKLASLSC